ncbi:MAG: hypothetical protein M1813_002417 [Trichoglossum hirsutum]|nr:MAG: hypothetical protein M1813_002417 [Trichoglossum hirsutum]
MPPLTTKPIFFGPFLVTSQVFHLTAQTFALVNLKPLLPGHVLVCPRRRVGRVRELTASEASDLFLTVHLVGRCMERVFRGSALNIAIQDGADAGQSVAHVHAHVIPRRRGDVDGEDAVYGMLEGEEGDLGRWLCRRERARFPVREGVVREPRSEEAMVREAEWFAREMEVEVAGGGEEGGAKGGEGDGEAGQRGGG